MSLKAADCGKSIIEKYINLCEKLGEFGADFIVPLSKLDQ